MTQMWYYPPEIKKTALSACKTKTKREQRSSVVFCCRSVWASSLALLFGDLPHQPLHMWTNRNSHRICVQSRRYLNATLLTPPGNSTVSEVSTYLRTVLEVSGDGVSRPFLLVISAAIIVVRPYFFGVHPASRQLMEVSHDPLIDA